jgi:hypothetical protein
MWVFGSRVQDAGEDMGSLHICLLGEEELESDVQICEVALQASHLGLSLGNGCSFRSHGLWVVWEWREVFRGLQSHVERLKVISGKTSPTY